MGCLVRACRETSPHFDPHSAINRLNRLVYSTQVGLPFQATRGFPARFVEETKRDKASVWFLIIQWDHRI
jgi:hypothetical protein